MHNPSRASAPCQVLREAQASGDLVQVERCIPDADQVIGYVVAIGSTWALLGVVSEGAPNGWVALQVSDIVSVEPSPGGRFVRRGLEARSSWPLAAPPAPLSLSGDVCALIVSASAAFPVLTLYEEHEDPTRIFIGRPGGRVDELLDWQELNVEATWEKRTTVLHSARITRLDLGGQYENALSRVSELRASISSGHRSRQD